LQTDWALGHFGAQQKRAIAKYVDFVRAGSGLPSLWADLRSQIYLGGDYSMKAVAAFFGVHYATVSRAVNGVEQSE
jgi:hypothetical protein